VPGFTPDLRKFENRLNLALLVKFLEESFSPRRHGVTEGKKAGKNGGEQEAVFW